jgi:putative oxidoreductase
MISRLVALHDRVFGAIQSGFESWALGLFARFVFAAVLLVYFLHSASTKVGTGILGFFAITDNAYFQILPTVVEQYDFDASKVPLIPYDIIVVAGTYAEFVLPVLIVLGLFTRLAALGMIGFVAVQSLVDVAFHGAGEKTIGAWFDRLSDAAILDQRLMWLFVLVYLVVRGAGAVSLDQVVGRLAGAQASTNVRSTA